MLYDIYSVVIFITVGGFPFCDGFGGAAPHLVHTEDDIVPGGGEEDGPGHGIPREPPPPRGGLDHRGGGAVGAQL